MKHRDIQLDLFKPSTYNESMHLDALMTPPVMVTRYNYTTLLYQGPPSFDGDPAPTYMLWSSLSGEWMKDGSGMPITTKDFHGLVEYAERRQLPTPYHHFTIYQVIGDHAQEAPIFTTISFHPPHDYMRSMSQACDFFNSCASVSDQPTHPQYKRSVMAHALLWGLQTNRTSQHLEHYLLGKWYDIGEVLDCLTAGWDGQDHMNGALHSANLNLMTALHKERAQR